MTKSERELLLLLAEIVRERVEKDRMDWEGTGLQYEIGALIDAVKDDPSVERD